MVTYGYFNSVNGDRVYNADQMSEYFEGLVSNGVYQRVGEAMVVMAGDGMKVKVYSGRAIIGCKWLRNTSAYELTINPANALNPRYTAVIVKLDTANRAMLITTKDGEAAASPVRPTIDSATELCLAMVYVAAGATSIAQANITDMRSSSSCGWVTGLIRQVDTSTLFLQWQDAYQTFYDDMTAGFQTWFDSLTQQLNVNTYIKQYRRHVNLASGHGNTFDFVTSDYTYERGDIIEVYINGLLANDNTDYTIYYPGDTGYETATTFTVKFRAAYTEGTEWDVIVYKSKIGYTV